MFYQLYWNKVVFLRLHYDRSNIFSFIKGVFFTKGVKTFQFKSKDPEIKAYPLLLGNGLYHFTSTNMKKTRVNHFCADFDVIDISDIEDTQKKRKEKNPK